MARRVAAGEVSPVELVTNSLERIADVNGRLNCFCFVWDSEAIDAARRAEAAVARAASRGETLGPLHGVPIALKDTTPTAGHRTTLGSYTHEHWVPDSDAYIAAKLQQAGAIVVGKTTTPEFAHTLFTESLLWGITRNPWDLSRAPGGSSGGSGAAVASGCVPLAEGSDMGGSVRIPAAWCGVVGLKPGLGRIPMDTLPGLFDSISHHGPIARCVDDARLFVHAAQGPDDADIMSVTTPLDLSMPTPTSVAGMRIGVSVDYGSWHVEPAISAAVLAAAAKLRDAGAIVEDVALLLTSRDEAVWVDLWGVFMATYYGHFVPEFGDRMDPDVLGLIDHGNSLSAVHLKKLEIARTDMWRRVASVLANHEVILCPTMATGPVPASKADRVLSRPVDDGKFHTNDMTGVWNLVSPCPAMTVPVGFDNDGLPIGAQIVDQ